jgi:hypothetical protein
MISSPGNSRITSFTTVNPPTPESNIPTGLSFPSILINP